VFSRLLIGLTVAWALLAPATRAAGYAAAGPLWQEFRLTLEPGERAEALGPFWSRETIWERIPPDLTDPLAPPNDLSPIQVQAVTVAIPPIYSVHRRRDIEALQFHFLYPIFTYSTYGAEHRLQILQIFSLAGGREATGGDTERFTLFPFFFSQRSTDPALNYTGLIPFGGHVQNRLYRDEVRWVMWPIYVHTRKKDVITDNFVVPFVHVRHGDQLTGWQFWPFYGTEHRTPHWTTNMFGDREFMGGLDRRFVLWPFYSRSALETGTTNEARQHGLLPFYNVETAAAYDRAEYFLPLGWAQFDNHVTGYRQRSIAWPFFIYGRGPQVTVDRVFPFYGHTRTPDLQSTLVLWPLYRQKHKETADLDFQRTSVMFFLYTDSMLREKPTGRVKRRTDLWPFFITRRDLDGNERFQMLALIEPLLVNNPGIERTWAPVWSVWRSAKNPKTGAASQSLLWNLYRHESAPGTRRTSLFFGMVRHETTPAGSHWRWFWIPARQSGTRAPEPKN